jgi:hypothetical protein
MNAVKGEWKVSYQNTVCLRVASRKNAVTCGPVRDFEKKTCETTTKENIEYI